MTAREEKQFCRKVHLGVTKRLMALEEATVWCGKRHEYLRKKWDLSAVIKLSSLGQLALREGK